MRLINFGGREPREVTGRMVLASVVAFFAVIVAVNMIMATLAVSTFGGVETKNAYQAGLSFSREIASARAQAARDWHVDAKLSPWTPEGVTIDVAAQDANRRSISGVEVEVTFIHPANRRQDVAVKLSPIAAGAYRGRVEVSPGHWDLVVEVAKDGERLFRSKNRVRIR
jgi:nitrogen fixation protein FixH